MKGIKKIVANVLPHYVVEKITEKRALSGRMLHAPGGYYSPIPSMDEIKRHDFNAPLPKTLPGIDLNDEEQMALLNSFEPFYKELPFTDEKTDGLRYYYQNGFYGYSDAIFLYCMIRHLKPRKVIEAGSGFSSSVMLDTNERFMDNSIKFTFIEPYPQRLESLLKSNDSASNPGGGGGSNPKETHSRYTARCL